jgi:hypothetical protein
MLDEVYLLANKGKKEIIKEQFGSKTANKILLELLYQEKIVLANFQFLLTLQKLLLAIISLVILIKSIFLLSNFSFVNKEFIVPIKTKSHEKIS